MHEQTYDIAQLSSTGNLSFLVLLLILAGVLLLVWRKSMPDAARKVSGTLMIGVILMFSWVWYKAQSANIALDMKEFELDVPFYGVTLPRTDILSAGIRQWDRNEEPGLMPDLRSNGIGMPGFQLGWFRLKDGRKALVAGGQGDWVVIPTRQDYLIMVTTDDAERLMKAL
ncbi:PH domain-containing protein [Shewanella corallii]|uniref:PH domain-containing protein n=1 Tax=Shewanella corallii TaxID=560080 RepID=A0ABT0ND23_9GAMM|nr:PH domain-containing protein [Shewanella corallii]MCL2916374.1 PH domain-containing protein [Shewanella corallii]